MITENAASADQPSSQFCSSPGQRPTQGLRQTYGMPDETVDSMCDQLMSLAQLKSQRPISWSARNTIHPLFQPNVVQLQRVGHGTNAVLPSQLDGSLP